MQKPRFALTAALLIITATLIYLYRHHINSFFGSPSLANYLLLISILIGALPLFADHRRRKLEKRLKHSKLLVEEVFKKWFEGGSIHITNGSLPIDNTELGEVKYTKHKIRSVNPKDPIHLKYFPEAKEHLVSGYPKVWELWINSKELAEECNRKIVSVIIEMEDEVRRKIQNLGFTEWDERSSEPERWFITAHTTWWLYRLSSGGKLPDARFDDGKYRCGGGLIYIATPVQYEVESVNQVMEKLSSSFRAKVESINETKRNAKEAFEGFRKGIDLIVKEYELDKPLKGKCRYC